MTWGTAFDPAAESEAEGKVESIQLIGVHLRMTATVGLGRFHRLSDFVNASRGYIRVRDAVQLGRGGDPTGLRLPEVMIDEDAISLIAQTEAPPPEADVEGESGETTAPAHRGVWDTGTGSEGASLTFGAPAVREPRRFVLFTAGHSVSGAIHVFGDTDLAGFVASTDPRYVPVTDAVVRSLADPSIEARFPFLLLNRTGMIAASEADGD